MQLVVTLIDENDNTPTFLPFPTSLEVREDITLGTAVLIVGATDADDGANGNINYEIFDENLDSMQNHCFYMCMDSWLISSIPALLCLMSINSSWGTCYISVPSLSNKSG